MTPTDVLSVTSRDMNMYYGNTALPISCPSSNSGVAAFVIHEVNGNSSGNYLSYTATGQRMYTRINGSLHIGNMERVPFNDFISDGLLKPHPMIGYMKLPHEGIYVWGTTRSRITNRKGFARERLMFYVDGRERSPEHYANESVWGALFSSNEQIIGLDYLKGEDNHLYYKARKVGNWSTTGFSLFPKFAYLNQYLTRETRLPVEVLTHGNNRRTEGV